MLETTYVPQPNLTFVMLNGLGQMNLIDSEISYTKHTPEKVTKSRWVPASLKT